MGKIYNASWTLHADQKLFERMTMKMVRWFPTDKSAAYLFLRVLTIKTKNDDDCCLQMVIYWKLKMTMIVVCKW